MPSDVVGLPLPLLISVKKTLILRIINSFPYSAKLHIRVSLSTDNNISATHPPPHSQTSQSKCKESRRMYRERTSSTPRTHHATAPPQKWCTMQQCRVERYHPTWLRRTRAAGCCLLRLKSFPKRKTLTQCSLTSAGCDVRVPDFPRLRSSCFFVW